MPVWRQEDGQASVAILRRDTDGTAPPVHVLYINGTHQASDNPRMVAYHRLIGTLPMAIHSDPRRALVIGAGGGATAGAVAAFSDQTRVDVVELSPAVAAAARQFSGINQNLLDRPNVQLKVDDGRNHMLLTPERYDVITADVIVPMHAGAGNLYSVEYYRLMRRVLKPHGIAIQWIGSGGETEYKLIMRTFVTVVSAHDALAWRKPDGRDRLARSCSRRRRSWRSRPHRSRRPRSTRWASRASRRCSGGSTPVQPRSRRSSERGGS